MASPDRTSSTQNHILQALPSAECDRLLAQAEPVDLPFHQVLHEAGEPIRHVYFVEQGMISQLVLLEGGQEQEVGLVSREGLVGLVAALGAETSFTESMVQVPGSALRLPVAALRQEMARDGALPGLLSCSMLALHIQVTQTAACNGRHSLDERLARWLLMVHDRTDGDELPITQEFMSMMLGVRRAGVSTAVGTLEKTGAISHSRGSITVLDRARLEAASCECYAAAKWAIEPLLPG